ncbi:MAG: hypothetical protein Ct9H90mP19_2190 [Gammaproteobacteria bacterium]|nr:MAG: hypothetical protein Ct9H90mP19_2190 [Gammaproteobacteria bacterium]
MFTIERVKIVENARKRLKGLYKMAGDIFLFKMSVKIK